MATAANSHVRETEMMSETGENLKLMADYGAWPLWSMSDGVGLDPDDLALSETLKRELLLWVARYDQLSESEYEWPSLSDSQKFDADGESLAAQVRLELPERRIFYFNQTTGELH